MMRFFQIGFITLCFLLVAPGLMAEPVNINSASVEEIASALTGIGEKKAQLIVEHRELHGPYQEVEELLEVRGIGENLLQKIGADVIIH